MKPNLISPSPQPAQDALGLTKIHEAAGSHVLAALQVSATHEHAEPDTVFNKEITAAIEAIVTLPTPAEQFGVCNGLIGALSQNLVKKLTANFVAAILLALLFARNLHAHLLGEQPQLKRRRQLECYVLGRWGIAGSETFVSRLCRAGQRALEALNAGLLVPSHPDRIKLLLPTKDAFLASYTQLSKDAGGKVPTAGAIADFMVSWKKETKKTSKPPTLLERIAAEKRTIREALTGARADTTQIAQANANLAALYQALEEAASAVGVRKKAPPAAVLAVATVATTLGTAEGASPAAEPNVPVPAEETNLAVVANTSVPAEATHSATAGDAPVPAEEAEATADLDAPVPVEVANPAAAPVDPAATDLKNGIAIELRGTQVLAVLTTVNKPLFNALYNIMTDPGAPYKFQRKEKCRGAREAGAWVRDYGDTTQSTAAYHELVTWARDFGHPPV